MNSSWDWLDAAAMRAYEARDEPLMRLCQLREQAEDASHDVLARLALYRQGRDLATQMGEHFWARYFEFWLIDTLLHKLSRPHEALDLAARAAVEVAKPGYDALPQKCSLQLILIACYLALDPIGYQDLIRAAFDAVGADNAQWFDCQLYHAQLWSHFLSDTQNEGALDAAWEYLRLAETEHQGWDVKCALNLLCSLVWRCDERQSLSEIAAESERLSGLYDQNDDIAESQMWRAVAARYEGDEPAAQRFYRLAWKTQKRAPHPQDDAHKAAVIYHEIGGEPRQALEVCLLEIEVLSGHNLAFLEAKSRLKACALMRQLGVSMDEQAARLRALTAELRSKSYWEAQLRRLGITEFER